MSRKRERRAEEEGQRKRDRAEGGREEKSESSRSIFMGYPEPIWSNLLLPPSRVAQAVSASPLARPRHPSAHQSALTPGSLGTLPGVPHSLELNRVNFTPLPTEPRTPIILPLGKVKLDVLSIGRIGLEEHSPDELFSVLGLFSTLGILRVSYLATPRNVSTPAELTRLLERLQIHQFSLKGHSLMMPTPSRTMPYIFSTIP
ncbi:hypothetical protein BDY19DRAFT_1061015 [Irpex rosettiformis]|uniref:Uncharacterized protein n=1 Tax=Irpex rosettiformis TaxID=378272 RepID=A0ACB8TMT3_9APHY|nr:hypothetical protein BDY19DRAFT_1061015 [Irpex rosettiformis]